MCPQSLACQSLGWPSGWEVALSLPGSGGQEGEGPPSLVLGFCWLASQVYRDAVVPRRCPEASAGTMAETLSQVGKASFCQCGLRFCL